MSVDRLKRQSRNWRVRWTDTHGRRRSRTFPLKQDAVDFDASLKRAKSRGRIGDIDADLQPLSELVAEHFAARTHLAQRTQKIDREVWASNVDQRINGGEDYHPIAETPLRELTPKLIEEWRAEKLKAGKGANSVNKALLVMQSALKRAMREEKIDRNAAALVERPRQNGRHEATTAIAPSEVEKLRVKLSDQDALMVAVIAYAGLRPSEVFALQRKHIAEKTIRVEQAADGVGSIKLTKTERPRNVPMPAPLAVELRAWLKAHPGEPDDLIFGRWTDGRWRNWRKRTFVPAVEAAKIKLARPYDLRHAAASLWLHEVGGNYLQVAVWLGNSPTVLLNTYAHIIDNLDASKRVNAAKLIRAARKAARA